MRFLRPLIFILPLLPAAALADPHPIAVFSGLDKITGKIEKFEARIGQPMVFGGLEITVRACHKKPPEELPQTSTYVEVRQIGIDKKTVDPAPIFKGWMIAESPGLNGLEHPIYDIWLNTCKTDAPSPSTPAPAEGPKP